jgi:hypothetical protein
LFKTYNMRFLPSILLVFAFAMHSKFNTSVSGFENASADLPLADLRNNSMDIASADLDKDGDMDLVIASEFRPNVILFNDGNGKFTNASKERLPAKNHDSEDIALADFDKDGDTDIVFVSEDDKIHEYYINDGSGTFTDASDRFNFPSVSNAVIDADFDKDGDIDLILGNDGQDTYLTNDGKGNFTDETAKRLPTENHTTQDIEAADIDKDGDLDLILGNEDDNQIYINNGKGIFTDETSQRLPIVKGRDETRKVDIADVDGDGDADVFFSNVNFRKDKDLSNRLFINNGKGVFTDETAQRYIGANNFHTADVTFADLNGDKKPDLVVANIFGGAQQIFINNGRGVFTEQTNNYFKENFTTEAIAVEVGDWNKDGLPDLYYGIFRNTDVMLRGKK